MSIKSIFVAVLCEDEPGDGGAIDYAIGLAARRKAHLAAVFAAPKLSAPSGYPVPLVQGMVGSANARRDKMAQEHAERCRKVANLAGVTVSVEAVLESFAHLRERLLRRARVSDLTVLRRSTGFLSLETDLIEHVLFHSGRPAILLPAEWNKPFDGDCIVVAWDGGARAARAVGDALPFLERAGQVHVVTVSAASESAKRIEGADIAEHLARHCRDVAISALEAPDGDVAKAIRAHAAKIGAGLVVMGGYAHSRLRQLVLGGVTRGMLADADVPVLMSY